ncbi:hypothetical protein TrLO_g14365 [Triparma laevis f. longispina]|uniref:PX domain-containing protein n=1 Tax=Triparma laevis f. longispina TaxID=1714387 RepID=A0A9W7FTD5_9STRA|nr:hypothetical protein TrLO_g14365 [Triparma laevis f. longispina]
MRASPSSMSLSPRPHVQGAPPTSTRGLLPPEEVGEEFYRNGKPNSKQWGWFEEHVMPNSGDSHDCSPSSLATPLSRTPQQHNLSIGTPDYVLSESHSTQLLYSLTNGTRPIQPSNVREKYEEMWIENFKKSQVNYEALGIQERRLLERDDIDREGDVGEVGEKENGLKGEYVGVTKAENSLKAELEILRSRTRSRTSSFPSPPPPSRSHSSSKTLLILYTSPNLYHTTVSKTFSTFTDTCTMNISIRSYRVVIENGKRFAQFLCVLGVEGSSVGVWKRYSDFERLSHVIEGYNPTCSRQPFHPLSESLPNALCSWRLLKKRKNWFRCLDASYLCLKVFLLERFLHDVLFESEDGGVLREFVVGRI